MAKATTEEIIYEALVAMVGQEVEALVQKGNRRTTEDLLKIEKIARIYAVLKDDLRSDLAQDFKD